MILAPLLVSSLLLAAPPAGGIEQAGNASIQTEAHGGDLAQKAATKALSIFRRKGYDTQSADLTVVGIGDMSGDVFGNGMLLSEHIRLVAAFDHRHVFLDPSPDPEAKERINRSCPSMRSAIDTSPRRTRRAAPISRPRPSPIASSERSTERR